MTKPIEVVLPTFHADQVRAFCVPARFKAIRCGRRWGKALAIDTPIPTLSGWTTMGNLRAGDSVFDETGNLCRVIAATEVMHGRPCNLVSFSDGATIVADDDHQWLTWDHCARKNFARNKKKPTAGTKKSIINASPKVRTTAQIRDTLHCGDRGDANHSIPCAFSIETPRADLPVDPYVLGVWLGDGTSLNGGITCHPKDAQIIQEIRDAGYPVVRYNRPNAWYISDGNRNAKDSFVKRITALGVRGNKHIPSIYLRASKAQRLALFQGLMDTDGTTDKAGRCEFCSVNRTLAYETLELALTLGLRATIFEGRASVNGKQCGAKYRVKFTTGKPVFRLVRKLARLAGRKKRFDVEQRFITSVVSCPSVPVKCIQVNSRSRLYLAGRSFIPTHNTTYGSVVACDGAVKRETIGIFAPQYKFLAETFTEIADILEPVKKSSSKIDGVIRTITGGRIDFWTLDNERAGRSRKYHKVIIDEAAFTQPNMMDIWNKSIRPTLLDYVGTCTALSNTNGDDSENFFWRICNEPEHGFVQYHAPSSSNPYLPREEIDKLERENHPLVFAQEYLAEFVSWKGLSFFDEKKLLENDAPVEEPAVCDAVFGVLDSATKTGSANDGTAVVYCAVVSIGGERRLVILDWDITQIEGALLETWLPTVTGGLEEWARKCRARAGSLGVYVEDKASGEILLQQSRRRGLAATAIDSRLTAMGKDERAISVSGYVYRGLVKITQAAFDKVVTFKGVTRNHFLSQITNFRVGDKDAARRADDLLDTFTYSIAISLGNAEGF